MDSGFGSKVFVVKFLQTQLAHVFYHDSLHGLFTECSGIYILMLGTLDVVVPPDFIPEETSGDVMVPEGGMVTLTCRAKGHPPPLIQWRREDGSEILLKDLSGSKTRVLLAVAFTSSEAI
ncbi:hypothetical protein HHI36_023708 [Cryptolaemus montrouzieri]|uniref:Ig-like domain-containing protein n=1 Tax=Cryptolaemus montrouzieri TaxID=559131 RepID=A0ABD2PIK3_9CUCU